MVRHLWRAHPRRPRLRHPRYEEWSTRGAGQRGVRRKFLPGQDPIGATATFRGPGGGSKTIVGVVGDMVYRSLREEVLPTVYAPMAQLDLPPSNYEFNISIQSFAGSPSPLTHRVADALTAVDRDIAFTLRPLADQI